MKSILDPSYKYRNAASHSDPTAFARRMAARVRIADAQRKAKPATVQQIKRRAA